MLKFSVNFLFFVDFSFAAGSSKQSYSGQSVFGFVEKAEVKPIQSPRTVSVGSSGGDDGMDGFLSIKMSNGEC